MNRFSCLIIIFIFTLLPAIAIAGDLDSPGGPATAVGHMLTLKELNDYLTTGAAPGATAIFQEPGSGPTAGTMHSLQAIYDAIKALFDQITVTAADVHQGKKYFSTSPWGIQTGTMPEGTNVTGLDGQLTFSLPDGYYSGKTATARDANLQPGSIKPGKTIFGITGSCDRVALTGQSECWDAAGTIISCTGTGQNGEYQLGCVPVVSPSGTTNFGNYKRTSLLGWTSAAGTGFVDNGDGTVTDILTGLIWLENANCFGTQTWTDALSDANTLANGACGLSDGSSAGDWRLPNSNELRSLFDPAQSATQYLLTGHPFDNVQSAVYWSSTTLGLSNATAASVDLSTGSQSIPAKTDSNYVWPVRGGN